MHPSVVGLPCRLVLMVAPPGFPVDQPCDRQAPRAPLPQSGVTFMGKTSCAFSKGITLSSSLIRTHAPNLYPPSDFGLPLFERSLQVAASALLRKGSSQRYLCRPSLRAGTPTPAAPKVSRFFPWDIGLPRVNTGSALGVSHHCYFGWGGFLKLQSFLYVPAHRFVRLTGSSYPHT